MAADPRPVVVTGLPRSGTSWVGKMLEASGSLVYINEPMNPAHPPGRSPGVLDAEVSHYFQYVSRAHESAWLPAFRDTVALRYRLIRELRRNHRGYDLARAAKYLGAFTRGRLRGRRALLDDPYALFTVPWLVDRLGASAVVLVREPVSLVGSWRRLGWRVDTRELLDQPALMRDYLEPFRSELEAVAGRSSDPIAATCALWNAATTTILEYAPSRPGVHVVRYEDLAASPLTEFSKLYGRLAVPWHDRAVRAVEAATTVQEGGRGDRSPFRWGLRGGVSRTAYQPLDSTAALKTAAGRLSPEQREHVLALTAPARQELDAYVG